MALKVVADKAALTLVKSNHTLFLRTSTSLLIIDKIAFSLEKNKDIYIVLNATKKFDNMFFLLL